MNENPQQTCHDEIHLFINTKKQIQFIAHSVMWARGLGFDPVDYQ